MKVFLNIICIVIMTSISFGKAELQKPVERIIYEKYFHQLYDYEPAIIRNNQIESIEVQTKRYLGDSLMNFKVNKKFNFREDGRPLRKIEWNQYYSDSLVTNYKYDSLGNLVEYSVWIPNHYVRSYHHNGRKLLKKMIFEYQNEWLIKIFSYSNKHDYDDYLLLNFCDSLSYTPQKEIVEIFHGNGKRNKIIFKNQPAFIYPYHEDYVEKINYSNVIKSVIEIDLEANWVEECDYRDSILKEVQNITHQKCLHRDIENVFKENYLFFSPSFGQKNEFKISDLYSNPNNKLYLDTLNKLISIRYSSFISEPTSLENRNTSTLSTLIFNFDMQLIKSVADVETSRGVHEYSHQKIVTTYLYFPFGLTKSKTTVYYRLNANYIMGNQQDEIKKGDEDFYKEVETTIINTRD